MKIAVLITGNIRTWDQSNLLDFIDLEVDYFISTTNKKYNYHPFISNKMGYNDINNELITNDEIKESFKELNYKSLLINDDDTINDINFVENMRNIDSCYHQFNRIKKSLSYLEKYEKENNFKYDIIVKTRTDLKYFNKLSNFIDTNNNIYTSTGNGDPNDTILITKRDNIFKIIDFMLNEFLYQRDKFSHINPPHGLLLSAINNNGFSYQQVRIAEIIRL